MARVTPFPWYGSKYNQLPWLLDLLPQTHQYVEPFGGAATVLVNREPSPVETFNDINDDVVNFFEVLKHDREEFLDRLQFTPYSRELHRRARVEKPKDDIQRAMFFLVRTAQSFGGQEGDTWAQSITTSRRGRSQRGSAWESRKEQIEQVADRILRVQLESRDALDVIQRHDDEETLFYCDPPYPPEVRVTDDNYNHEMDSDDHEELASELWDIDGYVALSGYRCDFLDDLYDGWNVYSEGEKRLAGKGTDEREEVLYTNYDAEDIAQ
jgi:DNA adenine methylase